MENSSQTGQTAFRHKSLTFMLLALTLCAVPSAAQQPRQELKVSIASKGKWLDTTKAPVPAMFRMP